MHTHDAEKAIQKAESLLKEVREANQNFIAKTGKLAEQMKDGMMKAEVMWKKTEEGLKATEREAVKTVEGAIKDFYVGKDTGARKAA